jgi:hypothetical protein
MTYEMFADIDEDTALLRIFDTANTVMCALCTSQLKPRSPGQGGEISSRVYTG